MAAFVVKERLCVNDIAVPLEEHTLDFVDLHNLKDGDEENLEFLLLHCKATSNMVWLESALKLKARWWVNNSNKVPLLIEIRKAIETKKVRSGGGARLPKCAKSIVALEIRDQVIYAVNNPMYVTFAFKPEESTSGVQWLLEELHKDIEVLKMTGASPSSMKRSKSEVTNEEDVFVQQSLESIRYHAQCRRVCFQRSRNSFMIFKKDKSSSEISIPGLEKRRKEALSREHEESWDKVGNSYQQAVSCALQFLEPGEGIIAPLDNGHAPVDGDILAPCSLGDGDPQQ